MQLQVGPAATNDTTQPTNDTPPTVTPPDAKADAASVKRVLEMPSGTLADWIREIEERRAPATDRFGYGSVNSAGAVRLRAVERKSYSLKVCSTAVATVLVTAVASCSFNDIFCIM